MIGRVSLEGISFAKARRLVAWEYAAAASVDATTGVVRGPTPFGPTDVTASVPIMIGAQGWLEAHFRWNPTVVRAGTGLRKIFLYPQLTSYYGTAVPGAQGDNGNSIPVYAPDSENRLTAAQLGVAFDDGTPVYPMVYKPRGVTAATDIQMRVVGLELCRYRLEFWREAPPAGANYFQANSQEIRLWGQEGAQFPSGQIPPQRPLAFTVAWEGEPNVPNTDDPFLEGDAITLFFRYGNTTG